MKKVYKTIKFIEMADKDNVYEVTYNESNYDTVEIMEEDGMVAFTKAEAMRLSQNAQVTGYGYGWSSLWLLPSKVKAQLSKGLKPL